MKPKYDRFWLAVALLVFRVGLTKAAGQCTPDQPPFMACTLKDTRLKQSRLLSMESAT